MGRGRADVIQLLQLAAIGAGVYVVYKLVQQLGKVGQTGQSIYNQTAELLDTTPDPTNQTFASWYDPTQRIVFVYYLTFPDGNQHLVSASNVQSDGTFNYSDGNTYRIGNDKSGGLRAYAYNYSPDFGVTNTTGWS